MGEFDLVETRLANRCSSASRSTDEMKIHGPRRGYGQVGMLVIFALVMGGYSTSKAAGFPPEPSSDDFKIADASFKYKNKMINPRVVELFEGWDSDTGVPAITTVDIAAAYRTNQFYDAKCAYGEKEARCVGEIVDDVPPNLKGLPSSVIRYRWIGRLPNGLHVVVFFSRGIGSMVATSLFFFRFSTGNGWRPSAYRPDEDWDIYQPSRLKESGKALDKQYSRLLMSIERYYIIGDRVTADYSISGNDVIVTFPDETKEIVKVIHTGPAK